MITVRRYVDLLSAEVKDLEERQGEAYTYYIRIEQLERVDPVIVALLRRINRLEARIEQLEGK